MGKSILVMGHAYVVGSNREVWSKLGQIKDFDVDLIVPKNWNSNLVGSIEFETNDIDRKGIRNIFPVQTYFKGNGSFYFYKLFRMWSVLFNNKYDLVIINQEGWSLSLLFFNLLSIFTKNRNTKKFLMIAQNIKKNDLKWAIPLEKFNLKFITLILGCCSETEDVLKWKGVKTSWKLFPLFYNSALEAEGVNNFATDELKLGYIGRLSQEKGIETLLDSFKIVRRDINTSLLIAGDGPLRREVENSDAKYLGLLPHASVKEFYKDIDVLVVPSISAKFWKEQFGRVIAEAVAHGVAVVGSNSGAIPEVLKELELDYIFDEGDSSSLVRILNKVKSDIGNDLIKSKMIRAQELCKNKFSEKAFIDRLIQYDNE